MFPEQKYPCAVYDFSLSKKDYTPEMIREALSGWAKMYCFQEELTADGYQHYQGRISLIKKRRLCEIVPLLNAEGGCLQTMNLSLTSTNGKKALFYVMKKDTYVAGPWRDDDVERVLTAQLKYFQKLKPRPYMVALEVLLKAVDDFRVVHLVFDPIGNSGKSMFAEYMEYIGVCHTMPYVREAKDVMAVALATLSKAYIIDFPRGASRHNQDAFYTGIESLKNGDAADMRYTYRRKRFSRPNIVLFTNTMPDLSLLSGDRWKFWKINHQNWELEPFVPPATKKRSREDCELETFKRLMKKMIFS